MKNDHAMSLKRQEAVSVSALLDLVLESTDTGSGLPEFLAGLTGLAAAELSRPGREVACGITVTRHRQPPLESGSAGKRSGGTLQVALTLDAGNSAVVRFYAPGAAAFSAEDAAQAQEWCGDASRALRLTLRFTRLRESWDDIAAAMQSRTIIDLAVGAIMAQNRCSREDAFKILRNTSNNRNKKIRDVAAGVVASIAGDTGITARFEA